MVESMVEKVARAIYETWAQEKGAEADWPLVCEAVATTNEQEFPLLHETYSLALKEARAAIEAMRAVPEHLAADLRLEGQHIAAYHDIIDAALNERVSG